MAITTVDYYASANIFYATVTLTLDLLTPKLDTFIHVPNSISGKSLVKFCHQIRKIS